MTFSTNKPINQQELAKIAGVTRLTVQRALDGLPGVGRDTADRIRRLAREHGYRRNTAAQATRSGRLGSIDLLVSNLRGGVSRVPYGLLDGIHEALSRHGVRLTLSQVSDERLSDPDYMPTALSEFMADGLLINYTFNFPPRMLELIEQHAIPAIWLNTELPHDAVRPDDREAGRLATQHLIDQGHRRIGFVKLSGGGHYSEARRIEGYTAAMRDAGLPTCINNLGAKPYHLIEEDGLEHDNRHGIMLDYLREHRDLTAAVAYSELCVNTLQLAAARLGIRVPDDLSLITIADRVAASAGIAVDTVTLGWQGIGSSAVEMLVQKINRPNHKATSRAMPVRLERGGTVAPPRPS